MKDRAFTGRDVAEAVAAAALGLGLPPASLRYVVLEAGSPGGRGVKPSPARIAVLLDASHPGPRPESASPASAPPPGPEPRAVVRAAFRTIVEAAGLDATLELAEDAGTLQGSVTGADTGFFLGGDGGAGVLQAVEHLLQRAFANAGGEEWLHLTCEGFRERRDQALTEQALELAAAVKQDGVARTTAPLNSYERRMIHVALSGMAGILTYSVGEGSDRRVTVALAPPGNPDA